MVKPETIYAFIGFIATVVGLYNSFSSKLVAQEKRLVVLEKDVENLREFKRSATTRLNNHDEQNQSLKVLTEQIKTLSLEVKELNADFKDLQRSILGGGN